MGTLTPGPRRGVVESVAIAEEVASPLRHDLRNKFASIRNAAFYVQKSLGKLELLDRDARIPRFLTLICEQLDAANALLDERASYLHLLPAGSDDVRLAGCALEAVARARAPKGVELVLALDPSVCVRGNVEELILAVECLLDNALEASAPGDRVRLEVGHDGERPSLGVSDAGAGIAEDARERAFTPFVSDKPGHAGLGLNIAMRLAARNGARLALDADPEMRGLRARLLFEKVV